MSEGVNDDLLGCFVPFERPEYVLDSVKRGLSYGAKTIMFYLYPPRRLGAPNLENLRFDEYLQGELASLLPTNRIVIHAPYVINPASDNPKIKENTISTLRAQLALMSKVDLSLYVLHPGSYVNQKKEAGIDNLVELLSGLLGEFPSVTIALETMAGKGKQLCSTLEELAEIIRRVDRDNLGICIDTCHLWDYGYDVKEPKEIVEKLKELGLLERVKVIHLNDSKFDRYSKRDVHENINGRGMIGYLTLREWTKLEVFKNIPFILETPNDLYKQELKLLRGARFEDVFDENGIPLDGEV